MTTRVRTSAVPGDRYAVRRSDASFDPFAGRAPRLGHLDLELTERCNNACVHCYINLPANDAGARAIELTTAEWQAVLSQAAGLGALSVRFTGGEPLLREDFAELYLFARRLGLRVRLFTNARLITPSLADLFARVPPLEPIEITVYGMRATSYDAVTAAPGSFDEFRRGVELLLGRAVPFIVKGVLLPANRSEMDELTAWAAGLPSMTQLPSFVTRLSLRARRDSPARNRAIARMRLTPEEGQAVLERQGPAYRQEMARFCSRFIGPPGEALFHCGAGDGGNVDAYGRYQPCMLLRDPALTRDVRAPGGLAEALETMPARLHLLRAGNPDYLARCARCFLSGLCEQCPAHSWMEYGTLDTPVEYLCQAAHIQARALGLLMDGERAWEVEDWRARVKRLAESEGGS